MPGAPWPCSGTTGPSSCRRACAASLLASRCTGTSPSLCTGTCPSPCTGTCPRCVETMAGLCPRPPLVPPTAAAPRGPGPAQRCSFSPRDRAGRFFPRDRAGHPGVRAKHARLGMVIRERGTSSRRRRSGTRPLPCALVVLLFQARRRSFAQRRGRRTRPRRSVSRSRHHRAAVLDGWCAHDVRSGTERIARPDGVGCSRRG